MNGVILLYLAVSVSFYVLTAKYTVYLAVSMVFYTLTAKYDLIIMEKSLINGAAKSKP